MSLFHDESTFRCGIQLTKRWYKKGNEPFISTGRGKSLMVSDFLVSHPSGPFFNLNEFEWSECIEVYPEIKEYTGVNYIERTCTGSITPGQDNYFNSDKVLYQFERLFKMLHFKKDFVDGVKNDIAILVENARTHTAQVVHINDFCLKPGGNCPVDSIDFTDDKGINRSILCYDEDGLSKGLKKIAFKLGYDNFPIKTSLKQLKDILILHPVFLLSKNYFN